MNNNIFKIIFSLKKFYLFKTDNLCSFLWTTEIDPEIFADAIHHGMLISIEGIKNIIEV